VTGDPGTPCRVAERFGDILLLEEIRRLAGERKALILVHSGEPDPVKGAADLVGMTWPCSGRRPHPDRKTW
jgi:hypothetical protein